ncbi:transcriptional regulator GcvA [Salipiger sp. P9]|uniref:transcriptional regulator GcvA n=1 Tax=Salipiger pentaromativorans TaxID=2943193 RepID=UPI002157352B|nr:transcriptional regulator GcvA [Salipiger pentaromativorans]MCR8548347.1 transcriptional regulator GcvA [Salipiger pentaromativorans]
MPERLPPLTALRAFEAAARHMSFAAAAQELNVTPAALSFQIRNLEEHLGQPLFRRLNRAVELTPAGHALAPGCSEGFARLASAWRAARQRQETPVLTVTAGPAFTAKWLSPRLFEFAQCHPEIELRFTANFRMMDFERDEVDVAIRYRLAAEPSLWSMDLMDEWLSPMMVPALAARFPTPESLLDAPLLSEDSTNFLSPRPDWAAWFRASGIAQDTVVATRFNQADHAIDAALAGAGVVLTRSSIAAHALAAGRLVAPFPIALGTPARYRFVCAKGTEDDPRIAAYRSWLVGEIRTQTSALPDKQVIQVSDMV